MNDMSLLNELELKIRELVSSLEREREKNKTRNDSWKIRYYLKELSSYLGLSPSIDFYVDG